MAATDSIKVAVRVRPLLKHELQDGNKTCISTIQSLSQVQIRGASVNEAFTYNYVYGTMQTQQDLYVSSVKPLLTHLFSGYNVTVLAYGQTGSGKTHSMGTDYGTDANKDHGVIPRSVQDIFERIQNTKDCQFDVTVSFLELYNEQIRDLLGCTEAVSVPTQLEVREDHAGVVCIPGLTYTEVSSVEETMACLAQGSQFRSTGATAMNKTSSRSHAVFTIKIESRPLTGEQATVAKFCLVDLAGSERAKKTQATGERLKEGININKGLLELGNVISALGDEHQRHSHIPYRNSKLTRLLQDSLGGNSYTLMIACVSPADRNIQESLNTLRYADRARKIKNKPVVNADPKAAEIGLLRSQVEQLSRLLQERRKSVGLRKCPPGHQRIIDIVRGELQHDEESVFIQKIKSTSPRTKNYLRQVGIDLGLDEEEEEEEASGDALSAGQLKVQTTLFPRPPGASPNYAADDFEADDAVNDEEKDYEQHQAQLDSELQQLELKLQSKEAQMNELANLSLEEYEERCSLLQKQVSELLREKMELEATVMTLQRSNSKINATIAEQRRLQIKELERKITTQNKQLADLSRLRQEKKRDKEKISGLTTDIQSLKQAKVTLMREIKKSADNYRSWKQRQQKVVGRLQEAERKGRNQLDKQAKLHSKQQSVLQRKYQEAMAANKRMQSILQRRNPNVTVGGQRNAGDSVDKLREWLEHELEVERNLALQRETLDQLVAEKTRLSSKLTELETTKCWEDRKTKTERLNETRDIKNQISVQQKRIGDIEHELVGVEISDYKSPHSRWAGVTNLSDARFMLNHLFTNNIQHLQTLAERNERVAELEEVNFRLNQEVKDIQNKMKQSQNEALKQLTPLVLKTPSVFSTPKVPITENRNQVASTIFSKRKMSFFANPYESEEEVFDDDVTVDHETKDPDWRLTPFLKNERKQMRKRTSSTENVSNRCSCKGKCNTKRCSCKKNNGSCAENCSCIAEHCENREEDTSNEKEPDLNATYALNSTPKEAALFSSLKRDSTELSEDAAQVVEVPKKRKLFNKVNDVD